MPSGVCIPAPVCRARSRTVQLGRSCGEQPGVRTRLRVMTTAPTTGVRRRMGVEERREQLITVALDLFSHRSPAEVSIDDIATAARISRPLLYHYFPGKHSLYEAAVRRAADELAAG